MRYRANTRVGRRRGIVLLLVIAMLTLFTALALGFVFYAEAEGQASGLMSDTHNRRFPDADPEQLASFVLSQLIYDTQNVYSAGRGHSLGRTMYGYNPYGANSSAYSGMGRLHYTYTSPPYPLPLKGLDDFNLVNYTYYPPSPINPIAFLRDPEYYGFRASPSSYLDPKLYRAGNAPYTYQDLNSMFLALVNANGEVITNSFHRPYLDTKSKYQTMFVTRQYNDGLDYAGNPLLNYQGNPLGLFNQTATDLQYDAINTPSYGITPPPFTVPVGGHVRNLDQSLGFKVATTYVGPPQPLVPTVPVALSVASVAGFPARSGGFFAVGLDPKANPTVLKLTYSDIDPFNNKLLGVTGDAGVVGLPPPLPGQPGPLVYTYASNDSYWMDLGYPIMVAPNGQKYKALFAPLIVDMDSRINLWLANANTSGGTSNQGYAATEVSLNPLGAPAADLQALQQLRFGATGAAEPFGYTWVLTPAPTPPTAGVFSITVNGATTGNLAFNASAKQVLNALTKIFGPTVSVNGGTLVNPNPNPNNLVNAGPILITFTCPSPLPASPPYSLTVRQGNLRGGGINAMPTNLPLTSGPVYARNDANAQNGGLMKFPSPSFATTQVSVLSNGQPLQSAPVPPPKDINVVSTAGFPKSGTIAVLSSTGIQLVNYTNITATSFQNCIGGTGLLSTGNVVAYQYYAFPDYPNGQPYVSYVPNPPGPVQPKVFPSWYSNAGAGQTLAAELQGNSLAYNVFLPMGRNNVPLPASHLEALLRPSGPGTPASAFLQLMPNTFATTRNRSLVTSASWSLDRPTGSPYIPFDPTTVGSYTLAGGSPAYPRMSPTLSSPSFNGSYTAPANSEFLPAYTGSVYSGMPTEFRSNLANLLRVDVNRLSKGMPYIAIVGGVPKVIQYQYDYPTPTGGFIDVKQRYNKIYGHEPPWATSINWTYQNQIDYAIGARQQLAKDIYNVLITVTGAINPNGSPTDPNAPNSFPVPPLGSPASGLVMSKAMPAQYNAARWLAQLAVNIVDYVDNDDYMTPFQWDTTAAPGPSPVVYGTELPRVLVNEVQAAAGGASAQVELHNPFKDTSADSYAYPSDGGTARLQITPPPASGVLPYLAYQLIFADNTLANRQSLGSNPTDAANDLTNVTGAPAAFAVWPPPPPPPPAPGGWPVATIAPVNGALTDPTSTNNGFYATPAIPLTPPVGSTSMTVLLQRLVCPALPPPSLGGPAWNVPITVDYMEGVTYTGLGQGRPQPYAGGAALVSQANPPFFTNTFYKHNLGLTSSFDWLTHLDRPVVNALELLHVSAVYPHQLTHRFAYLSSSANFQHYAPWQDPQGMIYRALELLGPPSYMNGTSRGSRVPGKINANTANEFEIWWALGDPQGTPFGTSSFSAGDINNLVLQQPPPGSPPASNPGALITSRTPGPGILGGPGVPGVPGPNDRPFRPLLSGFVANWQPPGINPPDSQYPNGSGRDDSMFRTTNPAASANLPTTAGGGLTTYTPPSPPYTDLLIAPAGGAGHPYRTTQLLQKIFNNTTTTSNVFAVWITVGFFEVQDTAQDGTAIVPAKIGAEIGRDQGRQIRHRLFAIIDRTGLNLTPGAATKTAVQPALMIPPTPPTSPRIPAPIVVGVNGIQLNTMVGNLVEVGPDPVSGQSEVVTPTAVDLVNGTFTAAFTKAFTPGTPIAFRGNPGPQPRRIVSMLTAPILKAATGISVAGAVSNVMLSPATGTVTIGDPLLGPSEVITVASIDTTKVTGNPGSPNNPNLIISATQGAWPAGTPVIWTSNVPYQPRNDTSVVMHLSIIQ